MSPALERVKRVSPVPLASPARHARLRPRRAVAVDAARQHDGKSKCPVAGLLPPLQKRPFWEELAFTMSPFKAQSDILQGRPVARGNFMLSEAVMVGDAELAKDVLACAGDKWDVSVPPHLRAILGSESLGTVDEPQHMQIRKLMAPAFRAEVVDGYLPTIQALAERYAASWAAAGQVPQLHAQLKLFTFEVICSVVAGFRFTPAQLTEMSDLYATLVKGISFPITLDVPFTPFGKAMAARRLICERMKQQLAASTAGGEGGGLIASMMQATDPDTASGLTEQQLLDNIIGILIAGHDTTASTLGIVLYLLHTHPQVFRRLCDEQRQLQAKHGAAITPAAMRDMAYTEAVLREAWRMQPIVPFTGRRSKTVVKLGPFELPAEQPTWVALNYIQRTDPRWQQATGELAPDVFNPERFLGPEGAEEGAQLVFGSGRRSCLGASLAMADLKVMLAVLGRRYSFKLDDASIRWQEFPFPLVEMDCSAFAPAA